MGKQRTGPRRVADTGLFTQSGGKVKFPKPEILSRVGITNPTDVEILRLKFLQRMTHEEIARELVKRGVWTVVNPKRVNDIVADAIEKFKRLEQTEPPEKAGATRVPVSPKTERPDPLQVERDRRIARSFRQAIEREREIALERGDTVFDREVTLNVFFRSSSYAAKTAIGEKGETVYTNEVDTRIKPSEVNKLDLKGKRIYQFETHDIKGKLLLVWFKVNAERKIIINSVRVSRSKIGKLYSKVFTGKFGNQEAEKLLRRLFSPYVRSEGRV